MQICPGCGESNPGRFRECAFCGQPLTQPRESREERKVLTVVFCDLKGSTSLGERLDPESLSEVLELYFTAMTRVLERHGAAIQKFIGDAIVAAFGIPLLHEDDALRAVRAAVEMRDSLARLNVRLQAGYGVELQARIGVHTGEVLVRTAVDGQNLLTGDTMNTAARLEQYAGEDEVLIGGPTYRLVRDAVEVEPLEPLELRGKAAAVAAYRVLRVFGDEQSARRHDAPIVGRDAELATLLAAYERARQERRPVLATVLGDAGVGKSSWSGRSSRRPARRLSSCAAAACRTERASPSCRCSVSCATPQPSPWRIRRKRPPPSSSRPWATRTSAAAWPRPSAGRRRHCPWRRSCGRRGAGCRCYPPTSRWWSSSTTSSGPWKPTWKANS